MLINQNPKMFLWTIHEISKKKKNKDSTLTFDVILKEKT